MWVFKNSRLGFTLTSLLACFVCGKKLTWWNWILNRRILTKSVYNKSQKFSHAKCLLEVRWFQKDFLISSDSSKKRTNKFVFSTVRQKTNKFVCLFFGRIRGYQKSFQNYLTFSSHVSFYHVHWTLWVTDSLHYRKEDCF